MALQSDVQQILRNTIRFVLRQFGGTGFFL